MDNLLSTRTGTDGARYQGPNLYGDSGLSTPTLQNQEWNEWDKKSRVSPGRVPYYSNASPETEVIIVKGTQNDVEGLSTSRGRHW